MHTIGRVEVEGFRSWGDKQVVDFSRPGLVLLTGENLDRGKSSGAGKSTLFKAITTAFFEQNDDGSIKRHAVNVLQPERGCRIGVHFTADDGTPYYVVYAYAHPEAGTDWYVYRWNGIAWVDLREERKGDTKAVIEGILRMNYDQFINRAYMAQETVAEFIWRTHKERLEIFSGILDLGVVDTWVQSARDWRRETEKDLTSGRGRADLLTTQAAQMKAALKPETTIQAYRAAIASHDERLKALDRELEATKAAAESISALMTLKGRMALLQEEQTQIAGEIQQFQLSKPSGNLPTEDDCRRLEAEVADLVQRHREVWARHEAAKKRLAAVQVERTTCDSCEQAITPAIRLALVDQWTTAVREAQEREVSLRESKVAAETEAARVKREWEAVRGRECELHRLNARQRTNQDQREKVEDRLTELREILGAAVDHPDQLNAEYRNLSTQQVAVHRERSETNAALNAALAAIDQYTATEAERLRHEALNLALETRIAQLKKVEASLGDKGFKAYKIDASRTAFNNSLSRYLSLLSDGEIEAELVTEVAKADGKGMKAELDILVRDGEKAGVPIRQYSGGEKATLSLAILGSFWDLASSQAGGSVNVLLLDEPFANLDPWQEEKACQLLASMRNEGRLILVVTNRQSVRERGTFDREIRVVKSRHISRLEFYDLSGDH